MPRKGSALLFRHFLAPREADELFDVLHADIPWRQEYVKIFGKTVAQPRLTAAFADDGIEYSYSGLTPVTHAWSPGLLKLKSRVEAISQVLFNTALLNLYRNGNDSMGWHRDNEKELGFQPVIASVSLGAERRFLLRDHQTRKCRVEIILPHGSLLLMSGDSQVEWEHSLPKVKGKCGERINVTFRKIGDDHRF